ncbi:MAG: hypothetical protein A2Z20_11335 [Bdellovibrionales bacterium RBG_16_40_8]|nr:MAG: hypothetical protein A2Z20_11335 [Bdellovibrionales bacterium RBG_16_40_8]
MTVSYDEYKKAVVKLKEAIDQPKNDFIRDSVIQRFEFCVELSWKTAKKIMGTSSSAPKDVIREMAQNEYITNTDLWLKSIDMRNISSHTYKEDLAEIVYKFANDFLPELLKLVKLFETK